MNSPGTGIAVSRAIEFLRRGQRSDGHWEEYSLPVGASDAWVTAYVASALLQLPPRLFPDAMNVADQAVDWLRHTRHYPQGWGFNGTTGPDADSTSFAIDSIYRSGRQPRGADVDWLLSHWRAGAGFITYKRGDAWGLAHADVTPTAFTALPRPKQRELRSELERAMRMTRHPNGTWPSFWWRSPLYATYVNLLAAARFGLDVGACAGGPMEITERVELRSDMELALALGIARLTFRPARDAAWLENLLAARQRSDGSWLGAPNLRVTRRDCMDPSQAPVGDYYVDDACLITTATVLWVTAALMQFEGGGNVAAN